MVELFFFKPYDLKIQSMVVAVAFYALLAFDLNGRMIPFVEVDPCLQFCVAFEAFLV
jgi:hypothetical protein